MRISAMGLILLLMASTVAMAAPKIASCLQQNLVYSWTVVNNRTLIVTDRVGKKFRMSLVTPCYELNSHVHLAFRSPGGIGITCLSRGDYVLVPRGGGMPTQRCVIAHVQAYTPAPKPAKK